MKQAYAKVYIGTTENVELELSDYVESFSYEETLKKDNLLQVKIKADYGLELLESPSIKTGKPICFQFGFIGEQLSEVHTLSITEISADYSSKVTLSIEASDQAVTLKKSKGTNVYNGLTASEIAKIIATKYKLTAVVTNTTKKYEGVVQGKKNDFQFLKMLASEEPGIITYITNTTLYFVKRSLAETSKLLINMGEQGVISFSPRWQEQQADGAANSTSAVGVDPSNKSIVSALVGNDSKQDDNLGTQAVGIFNSVADQTGYLAGSEDFANAPDAGGAIGGGISSKEEATDKATSRKEDAKIKVLVGTLKIIGNPLLKVDTVVTIGRVARVHQGNWYVNAIKHDIAGSAYISTLDLAKNATSRKDMGNTVKNGTVNNTIGGDTVTNSKPIDEYFIFNGNANRVGRGNKDVVEYYHDVGVLPKSTTYDNRSLNPNNK